MAKTLLSIQELQARALAEIQKQPGCSNVRKIASRMSGLKIIGQCVCYPPALPMRTRRRALRSMSSTSCATTSI